MSNSILVKVEKQGRSLVAIDTQGNVVPDVWKGTMKKAFELGTALRKDEGDAKFRQIPMEEYLTAFSDAIRRKEITYNQKHFDKI